MIPFFKESAITGHTMCDPSQKKRWQHYQKISWQRHISSHLKSRKIVATGRELASNGVAQLSKSEL
jgi:hypothetical protein